MLILFEKITEANRGVGGKAWGLGQLAQRGFPVPAGLVLDAEPDEQDWQAILKWWAQQKFALLAVRSSAGAEDTAETSFAGQNRTYLNVGSSEELRNAVQGCFASVFRDNSKAYRKFFGNESRGQMNVVLQVMVKASFAGVFFSDDPVNAKQGWVLEVIAGLGEDLVSGKVTPGRFRESGERTLLPKGFSEKMGQEVAKVGLAVRDSLGFPLDMEWAFDENGTFFVLQARPITAAAAREAPDYIAREMQRLRQTCAPHSVWDGQTFAEWSGLPSQLTYSLWRRAFSPHHAFGNALRALGYRSFQPKEWKAGDSLLERVFGRAYVNLDRLSELYYGDIPYRIELSPRPHTRFDFSRLGLHSFAHFPAAAWNMLKVGWNLSTRRKAYYQSCLEELALFKHRFTRSTDAAALKTLSLEELRAGILKESEEFATKALHWPLVLVILVEATTQTLRQLTKGVVGEAEADRRIREWLGKGLHTITFEMQRNFALACENPAERAGFLARYGHRGPGEMDLSHPRWNELGDSAFRAATVVKAWSDHGTEIEAEIRALPSFKREMILEEWRWLKKLLETREAWKMELLRPYAYLRLLANELGARLGLGEKIHRLTLEEILEAKENQRDALLSLANEREAEEKAFRKFSLPDKLGFDALEAILEGPAETTGKQIDGDPLAPGIVFGEVRFVTDPLAENLEEWPENVVLAAVSTDPGWTALFARAKAIVVERGGILSHCAILSREMGLAAVGGVPGLAGKLKNGDHIWVDGNHGRITRDNA